MTSPFLNENQLLYAHDFIRRLAGLIVRMINLEKGKRGKVILSNEITYYNPK